MVIAVGELLQDGLTEVVDNRIVSREMNRARIQIEPDRASVKSESPRQ